MSFIKVPKVQIGTNVTAANNFVLSTNNDGTAKLARGTIDGTTQDILTVDAGGLVRNTNQLTVIQRVRAVRSDMVTVSAVIPVDDTIPQSAEGVEYLTVVVTPKVIGSKLMVRFEACVANTTAGATSVFALFRDSEASAVAVSFLSTPAANFVSPAVLSGELVSTSLAPITLRIRAGAGAGTMTINGANGVRYFGGLLQTSLTVEETI